MEAVEKRTEELVERAEALKAEGMVSGTSEAGDKPPEKKKLTDQEYAEALERGEVNPLKEDGFI